MARPAAGAPRRRFGTISPCRFARNLLAVCLVLAVDAPAGGRDNPLLYQDLRALASPRSLGLALAGIGGAGIAHQWDDELSGEVGDQPGLRRALGVANLYGSTTYAVAATLGLRAAAVVGRRPVLDAVSSEALRAVILTGVVVVPLKLAVRRERPDGTNRLSFPSGHVANAFALSTVLSRRYGPRLGLPLYTLAALVPAARIHRGRHFFSDTVAGAALGTMAGLAVTRHEDGSQRRLLYGPAWTSAGPGLGAGWRF